LLPWHSLCRERAYSVNGRCFDIGITTIAALHRFQETGDARTSGDPSEHASGNGSIMRLAPVPIRYSYLFPDGIPDLVERAVESSLPTHLSGPPGVLPIQDTWLS
jgi:ADP-ribosyl-[dinitrogen reductase] hydrolase